MRFLGRAKRQSRALDSARNDKKKPTMHSAQPAFLSLFLRPSGSKSQHFHIVSMSTSSNGANLPSLTSMITLPDSNERRVCHWPTGILRATTDPLGESSIRSVQMRSDSTATSEH